MDPRHKYLVDFTVTEFGGRKVRKSREVEFTKPKESWSRADYERLEKYLQGLEAKEGARKCDVYLIGVRDAME